jgi:hypothetical protein
MSDEPTVVICLDGNGHVRRPGQRLSGAYWIELALPEGIKAIEASVLWHTEGKGDEDMAVHEFWRRDADESHPIDPHRPEPFSTVLPNSPLSYEGQLIKLRWCVRVRVFLQRGKELLGERPFQLGEVHAPKSHAAAAGPER